MHILYLTSDLFFASRAAGAAQRTGATLETIAVAARMKERIANLEQCDLLLLDLDHREEPLTLIAAVKERFPECRVAAYAPHVAERLLQEAQKAGCDLVLTRGQFNANMDRVLAG